MNKIFENARVMSSSYSFEYLGDFLFRKVETLQVEGYVITHDYDSIVPIWNEINDINLNAVDLSNCYIHGVNIGNGILRSLSFDVGVDVNRKNFSATIDIPTEGNLTSLSSFYNGLTQLATLNMECVESISEDFSFSKGEDETFEYSRSLDVKIIQAAHSINPKNLAKSIASIFFDSQLSPFLLAAYPSYYLSEGRRNYTESYDEINGNFKFEEKFKFQSEERFTWTYTTSISVTDEETVVSENGSVRSNTNQYLQDSKSGFLSVESGIYSRCQSIYNYYVGSGCPLYSGESNKSVSINTFDGTINYDISYSNKSNSISGVIWEKTYSIEKDNEGFVRVTEDGNIIGRGNIDYPTNSKYARAINFFNTIKDSVLDRVKSEFNDDTLYNCGSLKNLFLYNFDAEDSEYEGTISYSNVFTNDPSYGISESGIFSRKTVEYSQNYAVPVKSNIEVSDDAEYAVGTYAGNTNNGTLGTTVSLQQHVGVINLNVSSAIQESVNSIKKPSHGDFYISDLSYTISPRNGKFTLNSVYNTFENRDLNSIAI